MKQTPEMSARETSVEPYPRDADEIPLSAAVAEVRRELKIAMAGADKELGLEVKEIELELTLQFGKRAGGGGGVNVMGFVQAKADTERSTAHQHRVKLVLSPSVVSETTGEDEVVRLSAAKRRDLPRQKDS